MPFTRFSIENFDTIQEKLIQYVYTLWLIIGITGSLLNLYVFSRKKLRNNSCCIYLFAASLDHLLTLIIGIAPVLYALNHPDPQLTSLWFCKLRGYLFQICLMLSRWFVAFACIDRYMLTSEVVNRRNFATKKNSYRIITVIIIVWFIICTHRLIFYEILANVCSIMTNLGAAFYHSTYVIIGGGLFPSAIMIVCAYLIRQNIRRKNQRQLRWAPSGQRRNTLFDQVHHLLLIQSIFYIIVTLPQLGNLIFSSVVIRMPNRSVKLLAIERFFNFFAELMLYLFPVTSFYLYTLTSRTFRSELLKIFRLKHEITPIVAVFSAQQYSLDNHDSTIFSRN